MKKIINALIIMALLYPLVSSMNDSTCKSIKINLKDLESITVIYDTIGRYKEVNQTQDMMEISELFNLTNMVIIKDWDGFFPEIGGHSYRFTYNYSNGIVKEIGYYAGLYLMINEDAYRINTTQFETFWELNYEEKKYDYTEFNKKSSERMMELIRKRDSN